MISFLPVSAFGETKPASTAYPMQYQGGSLPLKQNHALKAVVARDEVVFIQHGQRFAVPLDSITEIACGSDVRRRFGAPVLGLVPLLDLEKVEEHYVGVTWSGIAGTKEVVFKLSSEEYRQFVAALERLTGKRAVDTRKVATVVHYSKT